MESLEYAQNGVRLPLTDGRDFVMVDVDNPTLLISGPKESSITTLIETFKQNLQRDYNADSYRLIEFSLTDDNIQSFVNSCNKDLDSLANILLTKGLYMMRDYEEFKGQIILVTDVTLLTKDNKNFTELIKRITQFTGKYGIYLIAINVGDDIHISAEAYSSVSITRPNIDIAEKLYGNPFISTIIHPHHYFFKYMEKIESTEEQSNGLVLTISSDVLDRVHSEIDNNREGEDL